MTDPLRDRLQSSLGAAYTLEHELGGGGMSRVFVAEDAALGRRIVVKVLAPELAEGLSAERFTRELRLSARLQHPNIVAVHAAGTGPDGLPYYTMPFIDGASLRERIQTGPLPVAEAVAVLRDVARALAYAHAHGVVHRDIKPENVLLTGGAAVVADFGIAKALSAAGGGGATLTQVGMAVGTPAYMAPEQAAGEADVDHRADLYAWGLLAWEALAGRHPFAERTGALALIGAHLTQIPAPLAGVRGEVPPALAALVARCLAKSPAERPADAGAVLRELDEVALTPREPRPAAVGARGHDATRSGRPTRTLAVLPMVNTSGDPESEHFSDGLTDELIGALSAVASLRVTGRTSAFALKGRGLAVADVARTLGVETVLEGSVRRAGARLKARVQLVEADGGVLWAEAFDRTLDDIFAVQEEIAQAVVRALQVRLGDAHGPLVRPGTADLAAHDDYLKGRFLARGFHAEALRGAIRFFERAIGRDPAFAAAHAELSHTYLMLAIAGAPPGEVVPPARVHAARAVALDDALADAHMALGHVHYAADLDVPAAGRAFRRALALDPGHVDANHMLAIWHKGQRHFGEALRHAERALAADPLLPTAHGTLGWTLLNAGDPDAAVPHLLEALALAPPLLIVRERLVVARALQGRLDDAVREAEQAVALGGVRERALRAWALAVSGRRAEAHSALDALRGPDGDVPPLSQVAMAYAGLGEADAAIRVLERAFAVPDPHLNGLGDEPAFDPLRGDPRFRALVARLRHEPPPGSVTPGSAPRAVTAPADAARRTPLTPSAAPRGPAAEDARSLVVLPFANLSPDPDNAYFSDGLTEELIADLSRVRALRVISRTSAMRFKGTDQSARQVAEALGVRYVLEGSVRKAGAQLRITARLVDAAADAQCWADKYGGTLDDVFDLQERVSRQIVHALDVTLSAEEDRSLAARPTGGAAAYDCYLRAKHEVGLASAVGLERAEQLLDRGLATFGPDPLLRATRAHLRVLRLRLSGRPDAAHLADAAAEGEAILREHPGLDAAHLLLGAVAFERGHMQQAADNLHQVLAVAPGDVEARFWLGLTCLYAGHTEAVRAAGDHLRQRDPLSPTGWALTCSAAWFEGDFASALAPMARALELSDDSTIYRWMWGYALALAGRLDEAAVEADRLARTDPLNPYTWQLTALTRALRGDIAAAEAALRPCEGLWFDHHMAFHMAEGYALLGRAEQALSMLEGAVARGFFPHAFIARHNPFLGAVRDDPRFAAAAADAGRRWRAFVLRPPAGQ